MINYYMYIKDTEKKVYSILNYLCKKIIVDYICKLIIIR